MILEIGYEREKYEEVEIEIRIINKIQQNIINIITFLSDMSIVRDDITISLYYQYDDYDI